MPSSEKITFATMRFSSKKMIIIQNKIKIPKSNNGQKFSASWIVKIRPAKNNPKLTGKKSVKYT